MIDRLECRRFQELLSDHADGSLSPVLRAELEAHLAGCEHCRALRAALQEVVTALRSHPLLEPSPWLAERSARAALQAAKPPRPWPGAEIAWPRALRIAAALALLASGTALLVSGPDGRAARAARRLTDQAETSVFLLAERKDRIVEDVRILRVVIGAAFEGRLDRVNDRFEDYRRMIEKRRAAGTPAPSPKKIGKNEQNPAHAALVDRVGKGKERGNT
jgi:hypothetical protein